MIDLRGFGYFVLDFLKFSHSGYSRVNASVEELHKDIEVLLRQASRDLPLFVYGHSMGAGLVASLLIRNPYLNISGVIFSSAMFQFHKDRKFSWKKKLFLRLLGDEFEVRYFQRK
jgi:alpha-beta hydrolase superfamily lysophospholipase